MAPPGNTTPGIPVNTQTANINYAPCGTRIDLARLQTLASSDATGGLLVDTLNKEMMHGSIPDLMRNDILTAVQTVSSADPLKRARTALYLVATSPQFQVQR